jgi:hypothetical protein
VQLVFIHGPPAVGKLTVARELAAQTNLPLFHNHLVVDLLLTMFPFGSEPFVVLREQIWLSVFREAANSGISLIFTFAPERTVSAPFIQRVVDAVENAGGKVRFVALTCGEPELERRMTDASRAEFGKLQSVEQYRSLTRAGAFDTTALPADLTIDTGTTTPSRAAERITEFLGI